MFTEKFHLEEFLLARQLSTKALLRQAAASLTAALDATAFARSVGFNPDPWQSDLMNRMASGETKRAIACCSRQSGKSETSALVAVHRAVHYPGSLVLLVAPTLRQSTELYAKAASFLRRLPHVKMLQDSITSTKLANGSRIVSLPGSESGGIRGYSAPALVCVDESSFVASNSGLWEALLPMLAVSNGSLLLTSTPNGKQGFFYEVWQDGGPDWHKVRVPWQQCPRISESFIEEQRRTHGPRYVATEFECNFADAVGQYFDDEAVLAILDPTLEPLAITF